MEWGEDKTPSDFQLPITDCQFSIFNIQFILFNWYFPELDQPLEREVL